MGSAAILTAKLSSQYAILAALLTGYSVIVFLYASNTPRWNAPDEPAHFNYVREVAERAELPILAAGSYDFAYIERLKAAKFPAELPIDSLRYEAHQPPLYYLGAAAVYRAAVVFGPAGQILAVRLLSALLGALLILVGYRTTRMLFPSDGFTPVAAATLLAFNPMLLAVNSAVGNDPAANLITATILLESIALLKGGKLFARGPNLLLAPELRLGILAGLALLVKTTAYAAVVVALVALIIGAPNRKRAIIEGIVAAVTVSGWWFARNTMVYGIGDPLGLGRHNAIMTAAGQPPAPPINPEAIGSFLTTGFHSYWGQFGWMGVLLDDRIYLLLTALTVASVVGLVCLAIRSGRPAGHSGTPQHYVMLLMVLTFLLVAAAMIQYSFGSFLQPQGRYLFPAAVPIAIGMALGLRQLTPDRHGPLVGGALALGLVTLDVASLFAYIVPALSIR